MITELGSTHFKIAEKIQGEYPNGTKSLILTVGQYEPVLFNPNHLDELISILKSFQELNKNV